MKWVWPAAFASAQLPAHLTQLPSESPTTSGYCRPKLIADGGIDANQNRIDNPQVLPMVVVSEFTIE